MLQNQSKIQKNNPELQNVCKELRKLLKQRENTNNHEKVIEKLANKNISLETNAQKSSEEKGVVQETARKLSMEFQKAKSNICKGKGNFA